MKKLLAIMMALVMCCSLVVSASAAKTYSGTGFNISIDVDGEWVEYNESYYDFTTEDGTCLEVLVYTTSDLATEGYTVESAYAEFLGAAQEAYLALEEGEAGDLVEGTISGYDAFVIEEITDDYSAAMVFVCADSYLYQIALEGNGDDDVYNSLADSILGITIDVAGAEVDVEVEEEEEVPDEETEEEPADDDAAEDDAEEEKDDKKDKDDEDEDDGDNTTIIIIAVAAVAVVAIVAVVIVLSKKKK